MALRLTSRIVPARPITVAIAEEDGRVVAYGVLANVSESGACLLTDGFLRVGTHLLLQISFAQSEEMLEVTGLVVWGQVYRESKGETRRYGLEWHGTTLESRERLRELASRPVAPSDEDAP
jgi:Tfp pilus assembly protein PilZ